MTRTIDTTVQVTLAVSLAGLGSAGALVMRAALTVARPPGDAAVQQRRRGRPALGGVGRELEPFQAIAPVGRDHRDDAEGPPQPVTVRELDAGDSGVSNPSGPATDVLTCTLGLGTVSGLYTVGTITFA